MVTDPHRDRYVWRDGRGDQPSPALHRGDLRLWETADDVVAYERVAGSDRRVVLVNFADEGRAVPLDGGWTVELPSDGRGEGERYGGELAAEQAVLLR